MKLGFSLQYLEFGHLDLSLLSFGFLPIIINN